MTETLEASLFQELERIPLVDPHTHINALDPASKSLADLLGYHYYTELAHSAGMPREEIEDTSLSPRDKVARLVPYLGSLDNTVQFHWLMEICREFFDFEDRQLTPSNWEALYDASEQKMAADGWADHVLEQSGLEKVFLTNDFDDPLEGFDTTRYVPCLRTDDLVFHLLRKNVRDRLSAAGKVELEDANTLRQGLGNIFQHFTSRGAKACAISLPPHFTPHKVDPGAVTAVIKRVTKGQRLTPLEQEMLSSHVFWVIAEFCAEHQLPFDLMIGVNRRVYEKGVYQGQDLFDKRVSLIQYQALFNSFPNVTFPVSVLGTTSNQELASYAWIFPNVVTNGHWWYSNLPGYIENDTRVRLEAIPRTKQIGYYSDMYKLEFGLPKFRMYRKALARVLARNFVADRGWSEDNALALGRQILRDNVKTIFQV